MRIATVTSNFYMNVSELFREHGSVEILPSDISEVKGPYDLVIFTGGSDINPRTYGNTGEGIFNNKRDEHEISVFRSLITGRIKAKKVLGICRGLQLINICMSGDLMQDIKEAHGISHEFLHELSWNHSSPLSELFPRVNSYHHQGIRYVGRDLPYLILASEPKTGVIEAIQWLDRWLGFQFHPELMNYDEKGKHFANIISQWVDEKLSMNFNK